jgi:hypothetical protein
MTELTTLDKYVLLPIEVSITCFHLASNVQHPHRSHSTTTLSYLIYPTAQSWGALRQMSRKGYFLSAYDPPVWYGTDTFILAAVCRIRAQFHSYSSFIHSYSSTCSEVSLSLQRCSTKALLQLELKLRWRRNEYGEDIADDSSPIGHTPPEVKGAK